MNASEIETFPFTWLMLSTGLDIDPHVGVFPFPKELREPECYHFLNNEFILFTFKTFPHSMFTFQ